jgi:hypothetical protein
VSVVAYGQWRAGANGMHAVTTMSVTRA